MLHLIIVLIVLGIMAFVVNQASFIDARFKSFICWLLIVAAAIFVIQFLLGGAPLSLN